MTQSERTGVDARRVSPAESDADAEPVVEVVDVVAAALVDSLVRPEWVLAARRTAPPALAGRWELPGGKVEAGESHVQGLHRELREELGVGVVLGDRLDGPLPGGAWPLVPPYRMTVWFARAVDGVPAPLQDHDLLLRLGRDSLGTVPWLDSNADIVAALRPLLSPEA